MRTAASSSTLGQRPGSGVHIVHPNRVTTRRPAAAKVTQGSGAGQEPLVMTRDIDGDVGPIDYVMVEFPVGATDFDHELAREVKALIATEFIRVLDVLVVDKDDRGEVEAFELEDLGPGGEFTALEDQLRGILAEDDVTDLAEAMQRGTMAGVLVWENVWSSDLFDAIQTSGAHVIASGRVAPLASSGSLRAGPRRT
jgi:hypothetical protein